MCINLNNETIMRPWVTRLTICTLRQDQYSHHIPDQCNLKCSHRMNLQYRQIIETGPINNDDNELYPIKLYRGSGHQGKNPIE